ncbi:G-protein coupled receptor-associated protein LMBRD2B-like [Anneissia japonica]|uniref:G-protein coupled receptor-associated protein LMBRD2B-like n=1 Tax=Anneissia japonica TaxID=1529436 RepID=UPI0014254F20|nr:G-protein coupled receptor-associated protein LMBRD2B-like [Anneissia japonica]
MSVGPLVVEIICIFILSAYLLHKYGNWRKQHPLVTIITFISWYFSLIIIFLIPLDVSATFYQQCKADHDHTKNSPSVPTGDDETTTSGIFSTVMSNGSDEVSLVTGNVSHRRTVRDAQSCQKPWSYVPEILPIIWKIVYWTTFLLTWVVIPLLKSYANAGDFTVRGKLKSAFIENLIWYGSYLVIFGALVIYVIVSPKLDIDAVQLQVIGITASNTWGLLLLVLLLGYGLVEVPRKYWAEASKTYLLNHTYFQVAKLSTEKSEAEEELEDILEDIRRASDVIRYNHPLRKHVNTIIEKCPDAFQESLNKHLDDFQDFDRRGLQMPSEKDLVKLHQKVIAALLSQHRTEAQWNMLVEKACSLEDIQQNEICASREYHHSLRPQYTGCATYICTPKVEWYWKIVVEPVCLKVLAVLLVIFSFMVIWSEVTFFSTDPVLSLFAVFIDIAKRNYHYIYIEFACCVIITYLCVCSYYTVFKIRVFNFYYLAPHHQTDENSLLFCGMMLCRLTPPLCLNFLGLIHLDGHVTGQQNMIETSYTSIMGRHLDVLPLLENGFYIYYPITILLLCIATFFNLGGRCLSCLGFQQFVGEDDMTSDYVSEGRELIKRERRKQRRSIDGEIRRKNFQEKYQQKADNYSRRHKPMGRLRDSDSDTSKGSIGSFSTKAKYSRMPKTDDHVELLRQDEPIDFNEDTVADFTDELSGYSSGSGVNGSERTNGPSRYSKSSKPRGIFDDI